MHILFTDDNYSERLLFRAIIGRYEEQIQLSLADGYHELFTFLETNPVLPDIIFLDFDMPDKSGMDCLKQLRAIEKLKHLPVIIYSNTASHWKVNAAYNYGADFYIEKPVDMEEVLTILEWLMQNPPKQHLTTTRENFLLTAFNLPGQRN
jgi:DNA-binding response OmpR family regulator